MTQTSTYDHRYLKTRDPVRSPIAKQIIARLVLGWVTTGESLVLYVFGLLFLRNRYVPCGIVQRASEGYDTML